MIGGGIVGLAISRALARAGHIVFLIERHGQLCSETSARNSGVLHLGVNHPETWLKTQLCNRGREILHTYLEERGLPWRRPGKLLVARSEPERTQLHEVLERATRRQLRARFVDGAELRKLEPELVGDSAVRFEDGSVIDVPALAASLRDDFLEANGMLMLGTAVREIEKTEGGFRLRVEDPSGDQMSLGVEAVVNSAGLRATDMARRISPALEVPIPGYALGRYWKVHDRHRGRVQHLVYPLVLPGADGLGVHVTPDLEGRLRLGPDALRIDTLPAEPPAVDPDSRASFLEAGRRFLPFLEASDLEPDLAGIRVKLSAPGALGADFVIREESARGLPRLVNLFGIESPGLTACLAIGELVETMVGPA